MLLETLANASRNVAATRSRLKKRGILKDLFLETAADEVALAVEYLTGHLPQGRIGLGPALVRDALGTVEGDAGVPALTVADTNVCFDTIAATSGPGSSSRKRALLADLFSRAAPPDRDFLARLVLGELRQGALEAVILEGIADAAEVDIHMVQRGAMLTADPARVAAIAFESGNSGLADIRLELMSPVRPMLAQPAETMRAAFDTLNEAFVETKLDGARVQIHRDGNVVRVFTRQLNEVTASVPEVVEAVLALDAQTLILDGEVIALRDDGRPRPFQVTMRRFGRKSGVDDLLRSLPLSVFLFDCLLVDGHSLIDQPLSERSAVLRALAADSELVAQIRTSDERVAADFMRSALEAGHEGVMVKSPGSPYSAGNRGAEWLKVKEVHSLDLVVLAAEWGSGRRKGWLSNLHLGAVSPDGFVMLGKTFKGLTDKVLEWQTRALLERETRRDDNVVYVRPELVVEIAVNDIQASPHYPAGMALRFARVKRYRDDKSAAEADTIGTVRSLFEQQAR